MSRIPVVWLLAFPVVAGTQNPIAQVAPRTCTIRRLGKALKRGVMISYGTDIGGFARTENQAQEFASIVR